VGQFGTTLLVGFQLIATGFSALSQKFFTILFHPIVGQVRGTVWDNGSTWLSIDCDAIFGFVPKVFHHLFCLFFLIL
jgi:hypothetical protein